MSHQADDILTELQRRGVIVAVDGDTLCLKPRPVLDDTLLARVREAKPTIRQALRNPPAREVRREGLSACGSPHCAGCYEVGGGKKIHPPKPSVEWLAWLERWKPEGKLQ